MTAPRITTVIPTFRRPRLLRRAILSAQAQTCRDLVISVADNASGDDTASVVAALASRDQRIRYHSYAENRGATANFQYGMEQVDTEFFSFLSDDDLIFPGFYEAALKALEEHPDAGFFCSRVVLYDADSGRHSLMPRSGWSPGLKMAGTCALRMLKSPFTWTGVVFRTDAARRCDPLEPLPAADLLFLTGAAARWSFVVDLTPWALFTTWREGIFTSMPVEEMQETFRTTHRRLASLSSIGAAEAAEMGRFLAAKPARIAGGRLKRAFRDEDWESFDKLAAFLADSGEKRRSKRLRLALGRLRRSSPYLVHTACRLLAWYESAARHRRPGAATLPLEAVVRLHAPALAAQLEREK
ncbi:MAG: glycosyltransferase family 2 protein, partial [Acidobacteriota bacterium]